MLQVFYELCSCLSNTADVCATLQMFFYFILQVFIQLQTCVVYTLLVYSTYSECSFNTEGVYSNLQVFIQLRIGLLNSGCKVNFRDIYSVLSVFS